MRKSSAGSEFRFDPSMGPAQRLGGRGLFLELEATVELGAAASAAIESSVGKLLMHLPPNPWSPMMQSSFRELSLRREAEWPGVVWVPLDPLMEVGVAWRLHAVARGSAGEVASVRAGVTFELPDRARALRGFDRLAQLLSVRPTSPWQGSVRVLAETEDRQVVVRPIRVLDSLEQVQLADPDDPGDESYTIGRQRHFYDGLPALIELWGNGDYAGRAWIMLVEDVIAKYGAIDLESVQKLVVPHLRKDAKVLVRDMGGHVLINEI